MSALSNTLFNEIVLELKWDQIVNKQTFSNATISFIITIEQIILTLRKAAECGKIKLFEELIKTQPFMLSISTWEIRMMMRNIGYFNNIDALQVLYSCELICNDHMFSNEIMIGAIESGSLDIVKYLLHENSVQTIFLWLKQSIESNYEIIATELFEHKSFNVNEDAQKTLELIVEKNKTTMLSEFISMVCERVGEAYACNLLNVLDISQYSGDTKKCIINIRSVCGEDVKKQRNRRTRKPTLQFTLCSHCREYRCRCFR